MAKAKEGFSLNVGMEFVEPGGDKLADVTWRMYGFDNESMDVTGTALIQALASKAAEFREAKKAGK